jgi:putative transposase
VGYDLGLTLSSSLIISALLDALSSKNTVNLIHNSGQGLQNCSSEYVKILKNKDIKISMSGKSNPYDNAKMESFLGTLKVEESYMSEYITFENVLNSIPYFIEEVYSKKRLRSSLVCMLPEEFEDKFNNNKPHQLVLT